MKGHSSATASQQYKDQKGNQQFFELWMILQFATIRNQVSVHLEAFNTCTQPKQSQRIFNKQGCRRTF